jgi:hypothetical protein
MHNADTAFFWRAEGVVMFGSFLPLVALTVDVHRVYEVV